LTLYSSKFSNPSPTFEFHPAMSQMANRNPLTVVFLMHIALEAPIAIQGVWSPATLPFIQLNNTTLIMVKLYSALMLALCLASFLCYPLPDFLPGKRALAMGLCLYHSIASTILLQAPRFIPHSFGPLMEAYKVTPEVLWGVFHGFVGLGLMVWWQATLGITAMARTASQ